MKLQKASKEIHKMTEDRGKVMDKPKENVVCLPERMIEDLFVAMEKVKRLKGEYSINFITLDYYMKELEKLYNEVAKIEVWVKGKGLGIVDYCLSRKELDKDNATEEDKEEHS